MAKTFCLRSGGRALGIVFFIAAGWSNSFAAEKLKIATPVKTSAAYALPPLAAEEKGFWKQEGLQAEWLPFGGGTTFIHALAAGEFNTGMASAAFLIPPVARGGIDVSIVADLKVVLPFFIWVRADSPIKGWRDLKGARIGVSTLGALSHSMGRAAVKGLGLEGQVRFVGTGGWGPTLAAIKAGTIDAVTMNIFAMANLKYSGEAREIVDVGEYLPKDWMEVTIFSTKEFIRKNPEVVRRVVRSTLRAGNFVRENRQWAIEKMKSVSGYTEEAAPEVFKLLPYSKDGKINPRALENVRNFLVEYGIVAKDKAPPVEALYTAEFVGR